MRGKTKPEWPKRLGKKLATIRRSFGMSQNEMLRHLGLDDKYLREEISAYERGVRIPPLNVILRYSKAARVWVNVLIDDELDLPQRIPSEQMHGGVQRPRRHKKSRS
jgi:transcriptional regulator with XRE-family HTH domain